MARKNYLIAVSMIVALLATANAFAQSGATRPRRVIRDSATTAETPAGGAESPSVNSPETDNRARTRRRVDTEEKGERTLKPKSSTPARPYALLQQKQFQAARDAAREIAIVEPDNAEAWKIAGFAAMSLKQYKEAASDLERARQLQKEEGQDDPNTTRALAEALVRTENFEQALPLLVIVTSGEDAKADSSLLYYRGLAEYRTGKIEDATRTLENVIKTDPKNKSALFYLARIAYERNDYDTAITTLKRATIIDARSPENWTLLAYAYLRRAAAQPAPEEEKVKTRAGSAPLASPISADYLGAIRAAQTLYQLKPDSTSAMLYGQALIGAKQYTRASLFLEGAVARLKEPEGTLFYLLGVSNSRIKRFPKAVAALERAAAKTPDDANIYRELGYAYEVSKQYAKALEAYEKGSNLAPDDADFKESAERVRPFAK